MPLSMAAVCVVACKPAAPAHFPAAGLPDDIAAIEAELARNRAELESAGIMVAMAGPPRLEPQPPSAGDDGADKAAGAPAADSDYTEAEAEEVADEPPSAPPPEPTVGEAEPVRPATVSRQERLRVRARRDSPSRCDRICELADLTCDLAQRVCTLAHSHAGEPRYEEACTRAQDQCRAASSACTDCG